MVLAKVLANRLKGILPNCVSVNQSAFVEGRSILDNALVAFEVIHCMKSKTKGKHGDVALKIDFSKAYDIMDGGYIRGLMHSMGFDEKWIKWVMMCVESVNYSVK
ncbi:ribonuclease H, partial [Trifolium pratense]